MTKKSIFSHTCWAAVAVGTFFLGSALKPALTDEGSSNSGGSTGSPESDEPLRIAGNDPASPSKDAGQPAANGGLPAAKPALSSGDFKALAEQSVRGLDPIARRVAFSELLKALTPENAMEIREQLVAFGAGGDAWRDFNYSWGAMAGKDAVLFAEDSEESDFTSTLTGWASADPSGAISFLDNLPEDKQGERYRIAQSIVNGISDRNPGAASDLIVRLAEEGQKGADKLISMVAGKALRSEGFDKATVWSESLPEGPLKTAAMSRVAYENVRKDPESTAKWVENFAGEEFAGRVVSSVGSTWGRRDPNAAVTWLENLPESRGQTAGLSSVFGDWEDRDPLAATQYLAKMPGSPQRDSAISGFSKGYARQDPEAAIAWASDIGNQKLREETLTYAGQAYLRIDPVQALDWLESSNLSPETQGRILRSKGRRR